MLGTCAKTNCSTPHCMLGLAVPHCHALSKNRAFPSDPGVPPVQQQSSGSPHSQRLAAYCKQNSFTASPSGPPVRKQKPRPPLMYQDIH